jgi:hypothetical protein
MILNKHILNIFILSFFLKKIKLLFIFSFFFKKNLKIFIYFGNKLRFNFNIVFTRNDF